MKLSLQLDPFHLCLSAGTAAQRLCPGAELDDDRDPNSGEATKKKKNPFGLALYPQNVPESHSGEPAGTIREPWNWNS